MITSGTGLVTNLYIVHIDTVTLTASLPILTEEAVFNGPEKVLFLLHSKSLLKTRLSSYSTKSWEKLADANLSFPAHDLTIDVADSLLGFCESSNIRTFHTSNLKEDKIYWQRTTQRLLTFNPSVPECIAPLKGVGGIPVFHPNGTLSLSSNGNGEEPGLVNHKKNTAPDSLKTRNYYLKNVASSREIFNLPVIGYSWKKGIRVGLGLKNKQFNIALETNIYALKGWQLHSDLRYSIRELNYYFRTGDHSHKVNKQPDVSNSLHLNGSMHRILFNSAFSAGLAFSIQHDTPLDFEEVGDPNVDGITGGWTIGLGQIGNYFYAFTNHSSLPSHTSS